MKIVKRQSDRAVDRPVRRSLHTGGDRPQRGRLHDVAETAEPTYHKASTKSQLDEDHVISMMIWLDNRPTPYLRSWSYVCGEAGSCIDGNHRRRPRTESGKTTRSPRT